MRYSVNEPTNVEAASSLSYDPTSEQEMGRSPSPVGDQNFPVARLPVLPETLPEPAEDWNSVLTDLTFPPDSPFPLAPADFPMNYLLDYPPPIDLFPEEETLWTMTGGLDGVNELIRAAECVDSNELDISRGILSRLNHRTPSSASGKPLHRAAFYFREALYSLLTGGGPPRRKASSSSEIVQTIRAYRVFSGVSPIPMFSHFTATQALLESLEGSGSFIHVVDFDIGLGGKWASFVKELADRPATSLVVLITAVVPEEFAGESRLVGDSLTQFASEVNIGFHIEFVSSRSFQTSSFQAIRFLEGESTAVYLTPATFARFAGGGNIAGFLRDLRRVSPYVVVFVDDDRCGEVGFRRNFVNGLDYYSAIMESLDVAGDVSVGEWVRRIEALVLRPRIFAAVEAAAIRPVTSWKDTLAASGLRMLQLSSSVDFQAECLLGKSHVDGFHVARYNGEMMLRWHDRLLVATSAWR